MKRFFISLSLVFVSVVCVMAQSTTGRLAGVVSGPDGVLPGATVTVTDNSSGKELTVVTGGEGNYLFPQLEFGTYTVKITASGFKTYNATEVKIDVGREYTLSPTLEVGSVQENVTVTAGADVVTSNTAQVSNTVSPQQILSLPLLTRNPLSLTTLQAGVASNSAQATVINGMRTTFTNITRDGINIQDTFIRTNATDFAPGRPSVDDTGEFTIATSNAEADQGYGGAQIRLVTPRGTKDFHGALFAYNRNSKFAANSFFRNRNSNPDLNSKPSFRNRNQYGGKLSGPMPIPAFGEGGKFFYRDKGFFFFAYEGIRDPQSTTTNGQRTILTNSARNGVFTFNRASAGVPINNVNGLSCPSGDAGSVCTVSNILTFARSFGSSFSLVPASISPLIQSRILSQIPTVSNFSGGDGLNTTGYLLSRLSTQNRDQYSSRIDVDFNEKQSLLGIYNYNKELNLRPDADVNKFTTLPGVVQTSANKQLTLAYRYVITSNFINEVRGGMFTSEVPFDRTDSTPDYFITPTLVTFPENLFLSQGRNTKAFNLQDNADYIWGNHNLRFGVQFQAFKVNSYNDAAIVKTLNLGTGNGTPAFTAASNFANVCSGTCPTGQTSIINTTQLGTANGLLALLGGLYNTATQSFNTTDLSSPFAAVRQFTPFRHENHSAYVFDRWLVNKELTLTLGVRYELFPALRLNNSLALEPIIADTDNPIPSLLDRNGNYSIIGGNAGKKNAYYKTDWDNFAPNLGVAWTPSFESGVGKFLFGGAGKSVIRGGYSHIYGNDSIITSINNAAVGNAGLGRTAVNPLGLAGQLDAGIQNITPPAVIVPRSYLLNNNIASMFGTVFGIDPNLETPMIQQYNVGFQREFFGNTAFEIRYVGTRSTNLARGVDFNQIDIFNNGFLADFQRAAANERLTGNPFCTTTGCQTLQIFQSAPAGGVVTSTATPGRLLVGLVANGVSTATFINNLRNGTPADLALSFINTNANVNNQPCAGARMVNSLDQRNVLPCNPNAVPNINFLPNPGTGVVDYQVNDGFYQYDSLQIEVRRRFSQGLYFQANYTFSKNLTNAIGTSQQLFEPFLDNNRKELDKQRADYDQTHVFNFNGIYQLPFGKGRTFLNQGGIVDKIFGGWEVSGLLQWTSGAPITFVDTRGTFNRSGRSARQTPNSSLTYDQIRALSGVYEANGRIYWIDPSIISSAGAASNGYGTTTFNGQVFFNVDPGQTGNLGRAIINGPKYFNINAALLKSIRFGETMRVQLRAEAFNLLNNVNFVQNTQFANINSTSFGQITSAFGPREIQFAARFEF